MIPMTMAEKAEIQRLADLEGVTPEVMAERLAAEAINRRLRGRPRYPADVRVLR
jgi:hypothetical protein